jgi:hypothetical protein
MKHKAKASKMLTHQVFWQVKIQLFSSLLFLTTSIVVTNSIVSTSIKTHASCQQLTWAKEGFCYPSSPCKTTGQGQQSCFSLWSSMAVGDVRCWLLIVVCYILCYLHTLTTCFDSPCSSCLLQIDNWRRSKQTDNNKCRPFWYQPLLPFWKVGKLGLCGVI